MKLGGSVVEHTSRSSHGPLQLQILLLIALIAPLHAQSLPRAHEWTPRQAANAESALRVRKNPKDDLTYIWVPPGTFTMGCSVADRDCFADENPAHPVTLSSGFWMSRTEVTVRAYKRFAGLPVTPVSEAGNDPVHTQDGSDQMPAVDVTWPEAADYCRWAGGRLPTEAEWEYAARARSSAPRYADADQIAWYEANSLESSHPVGQKQANAFGLFDVLGNVWEWVGDWYSPTYYSQSPATDPPGPASGQMRVLRGGSWLNPDNLIRASDRARSDPEVRFNYFGFRCVWIPTEAKP